MDFNFERFKRAQEKDYFCALEEIKNGHKESHWMWYIFPQLKELGYSEISKFYGIDGRVEAKAYIEDEILRARLVEISEALLILNCSSATEVMGYPDNLKLKSCMTLFSEVAPEIDCFTKVLEKFFGGEEDKKTLEILNNE